MVEMMAVHWVEWRVLNWAACLAAKTEIHSAVS